MLQSMYDLRSRVLPIADFEYLSWPLWYDKSKQEIEETRGISLDFVEYMALKTGVSRFIKNVEKISFIVRPRRPEMLNLMYPTEKMSGYIQKD